MANSNGLEIAVAWGSSSQRVVLRVLASLGLALIRSATPPLGLWPPFYCSIRWIKANT